MSIVAMMRDSAAPRSAATEADRRRRAAPASTDAGAIAAGVARFIPTEAIAVYTAILPFLVPKDTALDDQNYTARWWLAIGVALFAVLFAVGVYKRAVEARNGRFGWPPRRTVTVVAAYAAWVSVIPGSPLNAWEWYTPSIGAIIGIVGAALISLIHLWFGEPER